MERTGVEREREKEREREREREGEGEGEGERGISAGLAGMTDVETFSRYYVRCRRDRIVSLYMTRGLITRRVELPVFPCKITRAPPRARL